MLGPEKKEHQWAVPEAVLVAGGSEHEPVARPVHRGGVHALWGRGRAVRWGTVAVEVGGELHEPHGVPEGETVADAEAVGALHHIAAQSSRDED